MAELQKPATLARPGQPPGAAPVPVAAKPADPNAIPPPGNQPPPRRSRPWKIYLIAGGLGFFVIAMLLVAIVRPQAGSKAKPKILIPTPTTVPRPSIPDFPLGEPSIYANDPQILQLEGAIKTYERQLDTVDLREEKLDPPLLDMAVDFSLPKK